MLDNVSGLYVSEILRFSWDVFKKYFFKITAIALTVYFPFYLLKYLLLMNKDVLTYQFLDRTFQMFLNLFIDFIVSYCIIKLTYQVIIDETESIGYNSLFKQAFLNWSALFKINLMCTAIVFISSLIFVIPGIYFGVAYCLSIQVFVIRGVRGFEALQYSKNLLTGVWWRCFGIILLTALILTIPVIINMVLFYYLPDWAIILTDSILHVVLSYLTIVLTVYFIDLDKMNIRQSFKS